MQIKKYFPFCFVFLKCICPLLLPAQVKYARTYFSLEDVDISNTDKYQLVKDYIDDKNINVLRQFYLSANEGKLEDAVRFETRVDDFCKNLEESIQSIRKPNHQKIVKHIYEQVHTAFFNKFVLENSFYAIDKNGEYNCVTATALFSVFLERLKVPFTIKELPTHVYIIAYPLEEQIMMETTSPSMQYVIYDQVFKEKFIRVLKDEKVISEEDAKRQSVNDLFDKHFFASESITIKQLIGIHYFNEAVYHLRSENFKTAYEQACIANMFYPCHRTSQISYIILATLIGKNKYQSVKDVSYLEVISRFSGYYEENELLQEFERFKNLTLFEKPDPLLFDSACDYLEHKLRDGTFKDHVVLYRNYETGRSLMLKGNISKALPYLKKAYHLDSRNLNVQALYVDCLLEMLKKYPLQKAYENLKASIDEDSILINHIYIKKAYITMHYLLAEEYFEDENLVEGDKFLKGFETLYLSDTTLEFNQGDFASVYIEASGCYVRKNNYTKAREYIKRGLTLFPENERLKELLSALKK